MATERRAVPPDVQKIDEIRIKTVPRYKTSKISGDEWRISSQIEFLYKGEIIKEIYWGTVEGAVQKLTKFMEDARNSENSTRVHDKCDQEGCENPNTITYKMKKQFSIQGNETDPNEFIKEPLVRKFCDRHSKRGDCALEDADDNYERLYGNNIVSPRPEDISKSTFGGYYAIDELDHFFEET